MAAPAISAPAPAAARRGRPRKSAEERQRSERRADLLRVAARLFRTRGFDATGTRDIAAAVGMRSGSPFYYFESKGALLYTVMREGMALAAQSQQQALAGLPAEATARAQLRVLIRHHFQIILGPGSDFIPVMLYEWRALTAAQRKGVARIKDAYEAVWMPSLRALADTGALRGRPEVARLFIFGALNWAVQWFDAKGPLSLDALTDEALVLFVGEAAA